MTYYLSFRTQDVGGAVGGPFLLEGDGLAQPLTLSVVPPAQWPAIFGGRNILFATHGFNVSKQRGAAALGQLDAYFGLGPPNVLIAVLWPGDCWLPVVDYPFEGNVAIDCGKRLAAFCNINCGSALSLSFLSHSLGGRLILQAAAGLNRQARSICVTAGAINQNCLATEYAAAVANAWSIAILASHGDHVLRLAFAAADPIADLLHDDHTPFQAALGYDGPKQPIPADVLYPWQVPDMPAMGHGNYLPPGDGKPPAPDALWPNAADFMKRAFLGLPQTWPPPYLPA